MNSALDNKETKQTKPKSTLQTTLSIAKELFIFSLIFYLILFILETIFPGFVSYNFSLNWALGGVLLLGLIAAFAPEEPKGEEEKGKPKIIDYSTAAFLGFCGGAIIFYKIQLDLPARLIVSSIAGVLIVVLSLVLLTVEDEEVKEKEEEIETFVQETFLSRKTFIYPIAFFRLLLFKKVNFPMILILIVFLFTTLSLPEKAGVAPRKFDLTKLSALLKPKTPSTPTPSPTSMPMNVSPSPAVAEVKETVQPSSELLIKILNGGAPKEAESDFAKTLKNAGFVKVFFGPADNSSYKNATLKFRPEDKNQANLIKEILQKEYSLISEAPSGTTSAEMTVILGAKENEGVTELKLE